MLLMCSSHFKLLCNVTPRILTDLTTSIVFPLIVIFSYIRREYTTKHRKVVTLSSNSTQENKKEQLKLNETLTKKLAKEHEEYMNKVKLERNKQAKEKYEQRCHNVFDSSGSEELAFESIPWPCGGSAADIVGKYMWVICNPVPKWMPLSHLICHGANIGAN